MFDDYKYKLDIQDIREMLVERKCILQNKCIIFLGPKYRLGSQPSTIDFSSLKDK